MFKVEQCVGVVSTAREHGVDQSTQHWLSGNTENMADTSDALKIQEPILVRVLLMSPAGSGYTGEAAHLQLSGQNYGRREEPSETGAIYTSYTQMV